MNLAFQYEYEDLRSPAIPPDPPDANLPAARPWPRWQLYAALVAFFAGPVMWAAVSIHATFALSLLWMPALLPIALIGWAQYEARRGRGNIAGSPGQFHQKQELLGEQLLQVDESGILMAKPHVERHVPWESVLSLLETERSLWLRLCNRTLIAIPRRAFADAAQLQQFKELVSRHVPENKPH